MATQKKNIPTRSLEGIKVPEEVLKLIPEHSARHYNFVPIGLVDNVLEVGVVDPDNIEARDALHFIASRTGFPFKLYIISQTDFDNVLNDYKNLTGEVTAALKEFDTEEGSLELEKELTVQTDKDSEGRKKIENVVSDAPVTKIVAVILNHATEGNASDVHIEPLEKQVRVRFRVDGILYTSLFLPLNVHAAVVARIKILTNMKLDERRKPQDGRFSARISGRSLDFRVSSLPTNHGEKIVLRILDPEKGLKKFDKLGLLPTNLEMLERAIKLPHGLVLVTGPTGSGKTTTLLSILSELDREKYNVISLEDPIEYNVEGVNQSQVRPEIKYTFASGLRSILRQDPDIIMVGEIRDGETAKLAVQAALTGHLVFSTLHTNNAVGAIPRLIDMGVEPFLLAPTLRLIIAQRLTPLLCKEREEVPIEGAVKVMIDKEIQEFPESVRGGIKTSNFVYRPKSSADCPSGVRGRIGVFEMFEMDKSLVELILKKSSTVKLREYLRSKGVLTMREDALQKVLAGIIPFEEVSKL